MIQRVSRNLSKSIVQVWKIAVAKHSETVLIPIALILKSILWLMGPSRT